MPFCWSKHFRSLLLTHVKQNSIASCKKKVRFPNVKIGTSLENHLVLILFRYFHDSLPYGSGPGTDTDLASVMNGEGNRRFDEVFSLLWLGSLSCCICACFFRRNKLFIWLLELLSLFQYISFTTIGKDPKDPSLVSNVKGEVRQTNDWFKVLIGPNTHSI